MARWKWFAAACLIALMVGLRLFALDSDAYAGLSWSSALLTDEGFYIHNARNLVLFGAARTDEFNNSLIMPMLHSVQVGVFRAFGAGAVQARAISVICGLLTLLVLFAGLRRAFGPTVAAAATLFLGLDHVSLLYSRLALMDTPAALPMVGAFYAFARGLETDGKSHRAWLFLCGALLGAAYTARGLSAFLFPIPFLALWLTRSGKDADRGDWKRDAAAVAGGLAAVLLAYFLLWYWPHRVEIARVNRYYLFGQLLPPDLNALRQNITHALFGDRRGFSPYLMRHTPVLFALALAELLAWKLRGFPSDWERQQRACALLLGGWLLAALACYACVRYAPPRYYVLFYPAMAALAALALARLPETLPALSGSRPARAALGGFLTYHVLEAFLHHRADAILYGVTLAVTGALLAWPAANRPRGWNTPSPGRGSPSPKSRTAGGKPPEGGYKDGPTKDPSGESAASRPHGRNTQSSPKLAPLSVSERGVPARDTHGLSGGEVKQAQERGRATRDRRRLRWGEVSAIAVLLLWGIINLGWTADWLRNLRYDQRDADRWLARNLPAGSVLLGDAAPGLCLRNDFVAVPVIPKLCNDRRPVESFAPAPRAIVILDGQRNTDWWRQRYPSIIRPENRLRQFHRLIKFSVSVYPVPAAPLRATE